MDVFAGAHAMTQKCVSRGIARSNVLVFSNAASDKPARQHTMSDTDLWLACRYHFLLPLGSLSCCGVLGPVFSWSPCALQFSNSMISCKCKDSYVVES